MRQGHVWPRDKGSKTHRIHRPHIRLPWFLITEVREKWSPEMGCNLHRGCCSLCCVLHVIFQCWFPSVSALHSFVGKWNLGEFGPGPTCSKETRSDWHFLEGYWDLLHFFSRGKGFLLSIRESWTVSFRLTINSESIHWVNKGENTSSYSKPWESTTYQAAVRSQPSKTSQTTWIMASLSLSAVIYLGAPKGAIQWMTPTGSWKMKRIGCFLAGCFSIPWDRLVAG